MIAKIKTVTLGERGQVVIPEEFRIDLKLKKNETLVLIEKNGELIIKKQEAVLRKLSEEDDEDFFWLKLAEESLKDVWDNEEDNVWSSYLEEE